MLKIANQERNQILINVEFTPPKYNRMWGADYTLMDNNTFFGRSNGEWYESIVKMYSNLWNVYQYQVFNNLKL